MNSQGQFSLHFTDVWMGRRKRSLIQRVFDRLVETSYHLEVLSDPVPFMQASNIEESDYAGYSYKVRPTGYRIKFMCLILDFQNVPFEWIISLAS